MNKEKYLTTTAISYPNAKPHIGHMYEVILGDIIRNFYTMKGNQSKLLTGTDEHGKKIQLTAEKENVTPKELCDLNSEFFVDMNIKLGILYDRFIRTTDLDHVDLVKKSILSCSQYIKKEEYNGYYNVREETYVSSKDAAETCYRDPLTNIPYEYKEEESYSFDLPKFILTIKKNINKVKGFNVESFDDRLNDLKKITISRLKSDFTWGIDFPLDEDHIVYVWFDALLNYITGLKSLYPNENGVNITHVIGKDIVWFHSVIYPAILESIGYPLYNEIYVHGFIVDNLGKKMSKSLGNVILPDELFAKYTVDQIRFYLFYETRTGEDLNFSEERLLQVYNQILVPKFLNMFQRVYKLISDIEYPFFSARFFIIENNPDCITSLRRTINESLYTCNQMLTEHRPWTMSKEQKYAFFKDEFCTSFYLSMVSMGCVIPNKVKELNQKIGLKIPSFPSSEYNYDSLYKSF